MKDIVHIPGDKSPEIASWDTYMGVPFVLRAKPMKRIEDDRCGFSEEDDRELEGIVASIEKSKKMPPVSTISARKNREEELEVLETRQAQLLKQREKRTAWEHKQIRRCLSGLGHMVGFFYFYYNFVWIQKNEDAEGEVGRNVPIQLDYRSCDDWITRMLDGVLSDKTGIALVKRRRWGWSWILAAFCLWIMLFKDGSVFFVTVDEGDQKKFFDRINFIHDRLPPYLRKEMINNALERKKYAPSPTICAAFGRDVSKSSDAEIRCAAASNPSSATGGTMSAVIIDEAGEIPKLLEILGIAMPMLAGSSGLDRAGCLILGGTTGKMDVSGHILRQIFMNPKPFHVRPVFVPGWMGVYPDALGNDDKEQAIRKIHEQIKAWEDGGFAEQAAEERRKYPLTPNDAFSRTSSDKAWPTVKITEAEKLFYENRFPIKYGLFFRDRTGDIRFRQQEPNPSGDKMFPEHVGYNQVQIFEEPLSSAALWEHPYVMGTDPIDLDLIKAPGGRALRYQPSDFAFCVYKRYQNVGGRYDWPVAWYYGRPEDLEDAFEQCLSAAIYYHDASNNIERQKGARLFNYIEKFGDIEKHIAWGTGESKQLESDIRSWGFHSTPRWVGYATRSGREWWKHNYHLPVPRRFIDESLAFGEQNTDLAVAFVSAVEWAKELDHREEQGGANRYRNQKDKKEPVNLWTRAASGIAVPTQGPGRRVQELINSRHGKR